MIDTHCHLYAEELILDIDSVLLRSAEAEVQEIWLPNIDENSLQGLMALVNQYPKICKPMFGLHPCYVSNKNLTQQLETIKGNLKTGSPIAIGEIGLDLYWNKKTLDLQIQALHAQFEWARDFNLPVALHSREAFNETLDIARQYPEVNGIFHCFTGSLKEAEMAIDSGYLLGIGGVITYKNSSLRQVVEHIDLKHLLLETDAPYLAPVPFRGKRNEPSFLVYVAQVIADVKCLSYDEVVNQTGINARRLIKAHAV